MGRKLLRIAAVVMAIGGLFLLQLYAKHRELPVVSIGEISPSMNFASVRIEGVLESDARKLRSGVVLYVVDDGTGTIPVFSNHAPEGKLPKAGSGIKVEGRLGVGAGNEVRMRADTIESISEPAKDGRVDDFLSELKLSDITVEQKGARMTAYGRVSRVWKPRPGSKAPHKIVLADPSGTLEVVHWFAPERTIAVGDELEVFGMVDIYKDQLQLKVWNAEDIRPFQQEITVQGLLKVSEVSEAMERHVVTVQGKLGAPRAIPGGVIYPLDDGSRSIPVLFWDKQVSGEERDMLDEGIRVSISAPVVVYKGSLELVPKDVGGFQVLE